MTSVEIVRRQLESLAEELNNEIGWNKLSFDDQVKVKSHMRLKGANGSLWVSPKVRGGIHVSVGGKSGERELRPLFENLFGREPDGYAQTKPELHQAYWRVGSFDEVKAAAKIYAKTIK